MTQPLIWRRTTRIWRQNIHYTSSRTEKVLLLALTSPPANVRVQFVALEVPGFVLDGGFEDYAGSLPVVAADVVFEVKT